MSDVRWTAKGPTLIIGLVLLVLGLVSTWRRAAVLGIVLAGLGICFIGYSMTVKDWCQLKGTTLGESAWGQGGFGGGIGDCLSEKGWLSF